MTIEISFKDLVDCYFALDYIERKSVFYKILSQAGLSANLFKRINLDYRCHDIIVRSLHDIKCEGNNLLNRPMSNLVNILSNDELDDNTIYECVNSYCDLMNVILKRKEQIDVLSLM